MFRKFGLGFLIQPALMASAGWVLMQADIISEMGFLAFSATPALDLVLAWAAVTANDIANRRADQRCHQCNSLRFVLLSLLAPVVLLLAGWSAWQVGWITEAVFIFGIVAPAGVIFLGWTAMVTNEIVV